MDLNSSGYWDYNNLNDDLHDSSERSGSGNHHGSSNINLHHVLQTQDVISEEEILDSLLTGAALESNNYRNENHDDADDTDLESNMASNVTAGNEQPSLEQVQKVYYAKGIEELENLKLIDLSPLANWKLSSSKQDFGLAQLRDDSPDTYWQSDGSNGSNANNNTITNNQLSNPHYVSIQFSKKVSLERISIFINYSLDESYTPSKIKIMAGSSDGWDLSEVCTVNFNKPIGWSHIIFNGIRNDGVLKCFMVKLIILANHQDGKDSHIRAIRCFGKKATMSKNTLMYLNNSDDVMKNTSLTSNLKDASGFLLNNYSHVSHDIIDEEIDEQIDESEENDYKEKEKTSQILAIAENVSDVIGFNSGFQSLELKSTSSIR